MNDIFSSALQDEELEAILNEVRGTVPSDTEDSSAKEWSADDIDRLIVQESGEEYTPRKSRESEIDEKYRQLFGNELDTELFSVQPINEEKSEDFADEMTDIFSGAEVDGQQLLYEKEEPIDEFDPELFSLETVFMPDDIPVVESKYPPAPPKPEKTGPLPPNIVPEEKNEEQKVIDYRKKFFEKLRPEDIEIPNYDDKDPEYPYDKSGIVVRKGEGETEDNLEAMPTVMAAEDVESSISQAKTKAIPIPGAAPAEFFPEPENVEGQIVLNDFVDIPDDVIPVKDSEQSIEESLWKRRKQKAKNFKLDEFDTGDFSEDLVNLVEDLPVEEEEKKAPRDKVSDYPGEYVDFADRNRVHTKLTEKVAAATRNAIIMGGIDLFMLLLAIIPAICEKADIETALFTRDSVVLSVVNALLIIAAVLFYGSKFFDICKETLTGKISADSAMAISVIIALIENTVSATFHAKVPAFGLVAVFALFLSKLTDVFNARRILDNFSVCTFSYEHEINTVHHLDNESEIFELGRGLLMGNAEILYTSKSKFPSDFMKNSDKNDENNKYILYLIIGALVASIGAGVVAGFKSMGQGMLDTVLYGFSVFAAAFCLSSPVFGKFIPAFITFVTNKRLNKEGTLITSIDAAEHIAASNAVVLDSADIFDRKGCTMHGMKDFKSMRIDVVLLYAAAMVIKSGGPLKECFEEVVDGRQDLLPPVKELVYEDKLGISARIYDQKVLLGNRNMLVHHNIKAPNMEFENKYSHDGRKVIYLACNEQLAAMFVVSYAVDENIKGYLKQLESNGIQILVRTNDVNVTEELISSKFGLNPDNFKILSSVAGRLFKRRKDAVADSLPAELIHDGNSTSMLRAVASCCTMATKKRLGTFLQIGVMVLGIVLATLSGCSEAGISSVITMLIMLLESVLVSGVLILDRK